MSNHLHFIDLSVKNFFDIFHLHGVEVRVIVTNRPSACVLIGAYFEDIYD